MVHADVAAWGGPAIFVCVHLDGEGCPPSVTRSQEQACACCAQVQEHARASKKHGLGAMSIADVANAAAASGAAEAGEEVTRPTAVRPHVH